MLTTAQTEDLLDCKRRTLLLVELAKVGMMVRMWVVVGGVGGVVVWVWRRVEGGLHLGMARTHLKKSVHHCDSRIPSISNLQFSPSGPLL